MNSGVQRSTLVPLVLFGFGILLLIVGTWSASSLTTTDEYLRTLRTPIEMMERGSWATPWLDGQPRFEKPPLFYWLTLVSYELFGITLFSGRLWAVLLGSGLAVGCALIHREISDSDGLFAGLLALGTIGVAFYGRLAMLDLPLAFFTTLSVWLALRWGRTGRTPWILSSALALGLGFLTKGPLAFLIVGAAAVATLTGFRKWRYAVARWPHLLAATALCLAVCLPWPLMMAARWPGFLETVTHEVVEKRALGSLLATNPLTLIGGALGLVFPWTLLLVGAMVYFLWPRQPSRRRGEYTWLLLWYVVGLLPFAFMRSYERYLIPLLPAMCVLCAGWVETTPGRAGRVFIRLSMFLAAVFALPFIFVGLWFRLGVPWATVSAGLAIGLTVMALKGVQPRIAAGTVAIHFAVLMGLLYPSFGINGLPLGLREAIGRRPVIQFKTRRPYLLSPWLGRKVTLVTADDLEQRLTQLGPDVILFLNTRIGAEPRKFTDVMAALGTPYRELGHFITLPSRLRVPHFGLRRSKWLDYRQAIATRSLDGLSIQIHYYHLTARSIGSPGGPAQ